MFVVDATEPNVALIQVRLIPRDVVNGIDLAANLDAGIGSGSSRQTKLKSEFEIDQFTFFPNQPCVLVQPSAGLDFAYDGAVDNAPMVRIRFEPGQRFAVKQADGFTGADARASDQKQGGEYEKTALIHGGKCAKGKQKKGRAGDAGRT